ncbi:MAG: aminoacetone oxidase family FAD-binding enzyme, partial [Clostridiales bacterium]|nr:aminoacetone oxidase family FAD-binding enzyme [Clostridiales bacterium]
CNLTNAVDRTRFLENVPRNPRFLHAALSALDPGALMALMGELGVETKIERGNRVFPASDRASDVTRALERAIRNLGVEVRLSSRVAGLRIGGGRAAGFRLEGGSEVPARCCIVATGGASYPATGSTGDGWDWARAAGHRVTPIRPALTPIETAEDWPGDLTGLTLKNVGLSADAGGKTVYDERGELLFTHFGLSGPLALTLSSYLPDEFAGARLHINLKPALSGEVLDARLVREAAQNPRRQLGTLIDSLMPHSLGLKVLALCGLSAEKPAHSLTQRERRALGGLIADLPLTVKALRGMAEAVVTRGGVAVDQINPSTMASKVLAGLYFAGEAIDVDALTGGFNLQIAFSTGALAGRRAALAAGEGRGDG